MSCVLPGLPEVFAKLFRLVSMLISDDLPTLDRPIKAYSGKLLLGHLATSLLLITKVADLISIGLDYSCRSRSQACKISLNRSGCSIMAAWPHLSIQ